MRNRAALLFMFIVFCLIIISAGCSSSDKDDSNTPPTNTGTVPPDLRNESELTDNLCNWPAQEFTNSNHVTVQISLNQGDYAIDFTLKKPSNAGDENSIQNCQHGYQNQQQKGPDG